MAAALPLIPANHWNRNASNLARKLSLTFGGRFDGSGWRHPYSIAPVWNPFLTTWEISIQPGYVNALETETPAMAWDAAPDATRERLAAVAGSRVRPWLSESPWIPLPVANYRRIGYDADPAVDPEQVPEFFGAMGVGQAARLDLEADGGGISVIEPGALAAERLLLRAIDIVLTIPKPAAEIVTTGEADGVRLDVSLAVPGPETLCSIATSRFWRPPSEAYDIREQLAAGIADAPSIERRVGTVFFVSPPDTPLGSMPDQTWSPYVRQDLAYNRVLAYRTALDQLPRLNLSLVTGLAGGIADPIFAGLLAPINEADAIASLKLSQASVRTEEWTL
jgi:hypothetical protein